MGIKIKINRPNAVPFNPVGPKMGFLMLLIGVGLLAGSGYRGLDTYKFLNNGIRASGEVVEVKEEMVTRRKNTQGYSEISTEKRYYTFVSFSDTEGKSVLFQDSMSSNRPSYSQGDKVDVIYMENAPLKTAVIDHGLMNWMVSGILGFIGCFFFFGGIYTVQYGRRT